MFSNSVVFFFSYWLYNFAQLQVLVVKAAKRRGHLQVWFHPCWTLKVKVLTQIIGKPETDCHYYRPKDDVCHVTIPHIEEPFRIAIRAFSLKVFFIFVFPRNEIKWIRQWRNVFPFQDHVVGSMALLNDISYNAVICEKSRLFYSSIPDNSWYLPALSNLFEAIPIGKRAAQPSRIYTLTDMNCIEASNTCRYVIIHIIELPKCSGNIKLEW